MNYAAEKINAYIESGRLEELIEVSEERHDVQYEQLIRLVEASHPKKSDFTGAIFITGPSSSGKTTGAKRIGKMLQAAGYCAPVISIDDYYRSREEIRRIEIGAGTVPEDAENLDYETVDAFDVPFFRDQMRAFLAGEEIALPRYDFLRGERTDSGRRIGRTGNDVLIVEGIQAMNPVLSGNLGFGKSIHLYICPFDIFCADGGEKVVTTQQLRFMRRCIRDIAQRGADAEETLGMWGAVRAGEEKYIKPMKKFADFFFNSTLEYEIVFYRKRMFEIVQELPEEIASRLAETAGLDALRYFLPQDAFQVPEGSIFREFYMS